MLFARSFTSLKNDEHHHQSSLVSVLRRQSIENLWWTRADVHSSTRTRSRAYYNRKKERRNEVYEHGRREWTGTTIFVIASRQYLHVIDNSHQSLHIFHPFAHTHTHTRSLFSTLLSSGPAPWHDQLDTRDRCRYTHTNAYVCVYRYILSTL